MGYQYKFDIAGVEYGMSDVHSASVERPLFDSLSVGNACSAELEITFWPKSEVPRMAKIVPYVLSDDEWVQRGEYWTDTRSANNSALTLVAYDAMMFGEEEWMPPDGAEFPLPAAAAVAAIAEAMGVSVDERTVLNESYTVDYPATGDTMRQMLCRIAAMHGGNWAITDEGKLRLIPLFSYDEVREIGQSAYEIEHYDTLGPISGINLVVDEKNAFNSKKYDSTGYVLTVDCPYGTQGIADDIMDAISGKYYNSFFASGVYLPLSAELGDGVIVDGVESFIACIHATFDAGSASEISAPGESTLVHEFGYRGSTDKKITEAVSAAKSEFTKTAEEIKLSVQGIQDDVTVLTQKAGQVELTVTTSDGTLATAITSTQWQAIYSTLSGETGSGFYFDFALGRFVYDGTGVFRSSDGESYIEVDNDSFVLYAMNSSGSYVEKVRIGFVSSETTDYPYIQLGAGTSNGGNAGLVKKFTNGIFVGNSAAKDATGSFSPTADYAGIFINTSTGITYVVQGTSMQNVYTGEAIAKFA